MILTIYVILLIVAGGSLVVGVKSERWIFSLFSLILFMVLSFQSYDIEVVAGTGTLLLTLVRPSKSLPEE